jgi:hypothetical protein
MNCLKFINLNRQYGSQRLFIVSALAGLVFFLGAYSAFQLAFPQTKSIDMVAIPLLLSLVFVLPFHKLFHCLPLWMIGRKANLILKKKSLGIFPMIYCQFSKEITRNLMMLLVLFPFLGITGICLIGAVLFPAIMPVFITFAAVNIALSSIDLLYFFYLARAPKNSFIENSNEGFTILVHTTARDPFNQIEKGTP